MFWLYIHFVFIATMSALTPFVTNFQGKNKLTSEEFVKVFNQFDKNGNGYLEASEIDDFLLELNGGKENPSEFKEFKESLFKKYDENFDGRISMTELAKVLPTEENFLMQFRKQTRLHVADFMKLWYHYDNDRSGYLENSELKGFLHDLLKKQGGSVTPKRLEDLSEAMIEFFDKNKDGKIELSELSKIIPVEENFLHKYAGRGGSLSEEDFQKIFCHYDQDNNGYIEDTELLGFIRDILHSKSNGKDEPCVSELETYRTSVLAMIDKDNDGRASKDELRLLFK